MDSQTTNEILTKTISVRLTAKEMETFQMICEQLNTSKYLFLRDLIQNINLKLEGDLEDEC